MAKKNRFIMLRIAIGIMEIGKKLFDSSCKKKPPEHEEPKALTDTLEIDPIKSDTENKEVKSISPSDAFDFSDDDEDPFDYWSCQKKYDTCTVNIDDVKDIVNKRITVSVEALGEEHSFKLSDEVVLLDVDEPGKYECVFEYEKNIRTKKITGKVLCLADTELYKYFLHIEDLKKRVSTISGFGSCSAEQREFILKNTEKRENTDKAATGLQPKEIVTAPRSLEAMFTLCKDSLSPELQLLCKELVSELYRGSKRGAEAAMILSDILHTCLPYVGDKAELPSYEECVEILQKYHYGDEDLIRQIARQIRLISRSSSEKTGTVITLLGPPGVGKTSLARGIAECFRKPFAEISCRDKNPVDLAGIDRMYDGARHGEFMNTICSYRGNLCLLLDEFDKMTVDLKEGDTSSLFDTVFDDRKYFCDRFSKFPCPVDDIVFIITCNDMSGVSEPIRNRFQGNIFTISAFDDEKKAQIGKHFIVPQYMKKHNFTEDKVVFTMDGLLSIAKTTTDSGARVMAQQVENLLGVVNNRIEYGDPMPVVVDKAFVSKYAEKVFSDADINTVKAVKGFCA